MYETAAGSGQYDIITQDFNGNSSWRGSCYRPRDDAQTFTCWMGQVLIRYGDSESSTDLTLAWS
jgi:hypothetical protein